MWLVSFFLSDSTLIWGRRGKVFNNFVADCLRFDSKFAYKFDNFFFKKCSKWKGFVLSFKVVKTFLSGFENFGGERGWHQSVVYALFIIGYN